MTKPANCKRPYMTLTSDKQMANLPAFEAIEAQRQAAIDENSRQFKADNRQRWIQAYKLFNGFKDKQEPDATEYYEKITGMIEETHGESWLLLVEQRFTEYQLRPEEAKAATNQAIIEEKEAIASEESDHGQ